MEVTFYSFSKRNNSLSVPTTLGETMPVNLKDNCSMENPVFIVSRETFDFNYCKFQNKYFWIEDTTSVRKNLWQISCNMDVLATYRAQILNTYAFVEYDTSDNKYIADTRIPSKYNPTILSTTVKLSDEISAIGTYVLTCVGQDGGVTSFAISRNGLNRILDSVSNWADGIYEDTLDDDIVGAIIKTGKQLISVGNAGNCIRACTWMPLRPDNEYDESANVYLGQYDTGITASKINLQVNTSIATISIPWQFSDWRNNEPYTYIYLYIPFIGVVNIPASNVSGLGSINVLCSFDRISGDMSIQVSCGNEIIGTYGANIGVSIPIGVSNLSPTSIINSIAGTAGSIAIGNYAGAVLSAVNSITPNMQTIGGIGCGSAVGLGTELLCFTICHDTIADPSSYLQIIGTPSMRVKQLKVLKGYVKTRDASVSADCENSVLQRINSMLDGGVFIE